MKFGFDVHGVTDTYPEIYSALTGALVANGHEVHIITGALYTDELGDKLRKFNIRWTHWFSIVQYHLDLGDAEVKFVDGQPWMEREIWNLTKAEYCEREGISLMVDDSPVYGSYFTGNCVYLLQKNQKAQEAWMALAGRI